jgi:hypothetical protein
MKMTLKQIARLARLFGVTLPAMLLLIASYRGGK